MLTKPQAVGRDTLGATSKLAAGSRAKVETEGQQPSTNMLKTRRNRQPPSGLRGSLRKRIQVRWRKRFSTDPPLNYTQHIDRA